MFNYLGDLSQSHSFKHTSVLEIPKFLSLALGLSPEVRTHMSEYYHKVP